jgi:hypothetical protein
MGCPYLVGQHVRICLSREERQVPGRFELGQYCRSAAYVACPFYRKARGTMRPGHECPGTKVCDAREGRDFLPAREHEF